MWPRTLGPLGRWSLRYPSPRSYPPARNSPISWGWPPGRLCSLLFWLQVLPSCLPAFDRASFVSWMSCLHVFRSHQSCPSSIWDPILQATNPPLRRSQGISLGTPQPMCPQTPSCPWPSRSQSTDDRSSTLEDSEKLPLLVFWGFFHHLNREGSLHHNDCNPWGQGR
jgi:hypothetical protein